MNQKNKMVSLYPLTKFYLSVVLVIISVAMPGILSKVICFVLINILAGVSGVWLVFIRRVRNSVGVLFIILLIIQTLFYPSGRVMFSFWIFDAKWEGLLFALKLGFTLMCVGGSLIWFFAVTKEKDFVMALEKQGMSPKASYVVLSTLQMVRFKEKIPDDHERSEGKRCGNRRKYHCPCEGVHPYDYSISIEFDSRDRGTGADLGSQRVFL